MSPNFAPLPALAGGALIGLAATALLLFHGRVAGIAGILGGALRPASGDLAWRALFLGGLVAGGFALHFLHPAALVVRSPGIPVVVAAGLLVGFGARLGTGCTSGHGVCGISRLSKRSLVATGTFMLTAFVTVYVTHHLIGGAR